MAQFKDFAQVLHARLKEMEPQGLFMTEVDKDALYDMYLASFPAGTNNIFREKTEHDCTCCKQFIRNIGGVVSINAHGKVTSIWEVEAEGEYAVVAQAMAAFVKQHKIVDVYLNDSINVSVAQSKELKEDGQVRTWNHFYHILDKGFVLKDDKIASTKGAIRSSVEVLHRSMRELTVESAEIVLELIDQNSLYRGEEHAGTVRNFLNMKKEFDLLDESAQEAWCWKRGNVKNHEALRFRGFAIGTLLTDLSDGVDMESAVKSFEHKVAPQNYQRPSALVTKGMIESAQKKVAELGLEESLGRRYAVYGDLTINNVLFADLEARKAMNAFDVMAAEVKTNVQTLEKVEEVSIDDFMANILPKAHALEVFVENGHSGNLASIIAPMTAGAPGLFKWGNPFSWSYAGEVADSIKERVKAAGGNVSGFLRVSLAWGNNDDLDLHMHEPRGGHIYFARHSRKSYLTGAELDIDMNGLDGLCKTRNPVENIIFTDESRLVEGDYNIIVKNYALRENCDQGFQLELEYKGEVHRFTHPGLRDGQEISALVFNYSKKNGITVRSSLDKTDAAKEVWGIKTQSFHKVGLVLNSPNHWDGEQTGNKHVFFVLDGCVNPVGTRGFYNEYLKPELTEHRKVFEILGGKMKVQPSDEQLSGLGFSSTQRNHLFVKVTGAFNRTVKVLF